MIHHPERFSQAQPAGFDGVFDWDFLRGAFGNTIMPMDFDGVVERYGHFLVFETKADDGVPVPLGQKITLESALRTNIITVFVVYGKTEKTITGTEIWFRKDRRIYKPADANTVYENSVNWFEYANRYPYPAISQDVSDIINALRKENSDLRAKLKCAETQNALLAQRLEQKRKTRRRQPGQASQLFLLSSAEKPS